MSDKISFDFDEPVALRLRYAQGLCVASRYYERWHGDTVQFVFSAEEGVFYLAEGAGALLNARLRLCGAEPGETVLITKRRVANPNSERAIIEYFPERVQST